MKIDTLRLVAMIGQSTVTIHGSAVATAAQHDSYDYDTSRHHRDASGNMVRPPQYPY
jgi:hypothetical protein